MSGTKVVRTFPVPRERLWRAWTGPEFAIWFGTEEVPVADLKQDVRTGGRWSATMHLPDGTVKHWVGEFLELDPPERLVLTLTDEPEHPARALVTVHFTESRGVTTMTMFQTGSGLSEAEYAQVNAGYQKFFDTLEKLVTG